LQKGKREGIFKERGSYNISYQGKWCDRQINEVIRIADVKDTEIKYMVSQFDTL